MVDIHESSYFHADQYIHGDPYIHCKISFRRYIAKFIFKVNGGSFANVLEPMNIKGRMQYSILFLVPYGRLFGLKRHINIAFLLTEWPCLTNSKFPIFILVLLIS